jgi:hypothetical protein
VLCVVVVIACLDYVSLKTKQSTPFVSAKAESEAPPPSFEEAARAMTNFGMTLSADEIMFGRWWSGVAERHKAGAYLKGPGVYVQFPKDGNWPRGIDGRQVVVVGRPVVRHDLPVFWEPKDPLSASQHAAGIPVPYGTDLYKASERIVIEEAQWCVVLDENSPPQINARKSLPPDRQ